jgi:hypothetical protein
MQKDGQIRGSRPFLALKKKMIMTPNKSPAARRGFCLGSVAWRLPL